MARYVFALCVSAVFAALGALVLAPASSTSTTTSRSASDGEREREHDEALQEPEPHAHAISGLWSRWPELRAEDAPVRFYFFHPDGIGLYRYGKLGLNTTNSFDWVVDGDVLELRFRKTGQVVRTKFAIDTAAKRLVLVDDPKEPFEQRVGYTFVPPSRAAPDVFTSDVFAPAVAADVGAASLRDPFASEQAPLRGSDAASRTRDPFTSDPAAAHATNDARDAVDGSAQPGVPGRLWIDAQKFATGGMGFSLYQLREAGIDGRGSGWHHVGDFDDWSTEALWYRANPDSLELWFPIRGDHAITKTKRDGDWLTLVEDPRGFWHVHKYKDAGPSFGSLLFRR